MTVPKPPMWLVMLVLWASVLAIAYTLVTCSAAHAAEDAVCRPYATQLLNNQMRWLWDRAFNHCMNLEEDNPIPPATGDWRDALNILEPDHTPIEKLGIAPAIDKPKPVAVTPPAPVQAAAPVRSSASAAAATTPAAKCKATHPSGFQANGKAGTYNTLVKGKWVRVACPG